MSPVNAYATASELPELDFPHVLRAQRDRTDPALAGHLNGFRGFVMGGGRREMNASRFAVLAHLQRVKHHVALEVEDEHVEDFWSWALRANAIVFTGSGHVLDARGQLLVDPETGDAEEGAEVPYPADAHARRKATRKHLRSMGISSPASLPPVVSAEEVTMRRPKEVEGRCFALLACALRAEVLNENRGISPEQLLEGLEGAAEAFSPHEKAFFFDPSPPRQTIVNLLWRYESAWVLAWSIGIVDDLREPTTLCDVPRLARALLDHHADPAKRPAKRRSKPVLLDALDLHFRLHWATTDARINNRPAPAGLEASVVLERHYALNWLTCFQDADWDDVTTPT